MLAEIICAGFGGQGVLTTGMILVTAGHKSGKRITWYPSYGSEMRGGTANCNVKISDAKIGNPYCDKLDILIAMNEPSIDRFEESVKPGGYLFVNGDMADKARTYRTDINVVVVDANTLAEQAQNKRGANIVILGAVIKKTGLLDKETFETALGEFFAEKGKGAYNAANIAAFHLGYEAV